MAMKSDLYDVNFCFHVPKCLESPRVALVPFIPSLHAQEFYHLSCTYPEVFNYLPFGPYPTFDDFAQNLLENRARKDPGWLLFAVFDKTKPAAGTSHHHHHGLGESSEPHRNNDGGALAGCIALINSTVQKSATEVGCVIIFPPFQKTHVTSNAIGLLLKFALDTSQVQQDALGLNRVVWQANALNNASIRAAERMGFQREALLKWDRVLPPGKELVGAGNGISLRAGDPKPDHTGRNTVILSFCWEEWENGGREKVDVIMNRGL